MTFSRTILMLGLAVPGMAQLSRDPVLNQQLRSQLGMKSMGDHLAEALESGAKLAALKAEAGQSLRTARQRYFAAYPSAPGLAQAKEAYERLLVAKDIFYLNQALPLGRPDPTWTAINTLTGGDIDRGIPLAAQWGFRGWVDAVRKQLGVGPDKQLPVSALGGLRGAIAGSGESYAAYARLRELEDFRAAGKTPPGVDAAYWKMISLLLKLEVSAVMTADGDAEYDHMRGWLCGDLYENAERIWGDAVKIAGAARAKQVVDMVLAAKGPIPAPAEYGDWQDTDLGHALMNHWGSGSAKAYLMGQLRFMTSGDAYGAFGYWADAERVYAQAVEAGGEAAVLAAAEKMRAAPKKVFRGAASLRGAPGVNRSMLADPAAVGCGADDPARCLFELLPRPAQSNRKTKGSPSDGLRRGPRQVPRK